MISVYFVSIHVLSSVKEGQVESNYKNDKREVKRCRQSLNVDVNEQTGTNLQTQQTQTGEKRAVASDWS